MAFHLALIAGAPWGYLTMAGRWPGVLPAAGRAVSALSVLVLGGMGFAVLSMAGVTGWVPPKSASFAVLAYMALAIVAHVATPSAAERRLWLPVICVMAAALAYILLN